MKKKTKSSAITPEIKVTTRASAEEVKRLLLTRYGMQEDEIKVSFSSDEEIVEFYNKLVTNSSKAEAEIEKEEHTVDKLSLTESELKRLREIRSSRESSAREKLKATLPAEAQASDDEVKKAMADLNIDELSKEEL